MSEYSNLKIIVKLTKYKVFSYDREEKSIRRERFEGSAYLVVWRSAFALISAWGDCSKIYVTHRQGRFPESY